MHSQLAEQPLVAAALSQKKAFICKCGEAASPAGYANETCQTVQMDEKEQGVREQDGAQGRRAAASGCIARVCCACCQWSRLPKRSVVAGNIFHRLRPTSHLLYRLIAGICGAEHSHQSFPLLGHSPASTFISRALKRVRYTHS